MHTRLMTFKNTPDFDAAITFLREKVIPVLAEQKGFRGVTASADRSARILALLSLWDTAEDRDASFDQLAGVRAESIGILGDEPEVERFEEVMVEIGSTPPAPGAALFITRVSMDPAAIDDNVAFFRAEVAPAIAAEPGFLGLRNMINRETGGGAVGTLWTDRRALDAAAAGARARRQAATARGITFAEEPPREVLLVHMN